MEKGSGSVGSRETAAGFRHICDFMGLYISCYLDRTGAAIKKVISLSLSCLSCSLDTEYSNTKVPCRVIVYDDNPKNASH